MFEYFPENYSWSLAFMMSIDMGAELSEVDTMCRPLRTAARTPGAGADRAWFQAWSAGAENTARLADADEKRGHPRAAAAKWFRAGMYHLTGERLVRAKDDSSLESYRRGLRYFANGVASSGRPVEFVSVPYVDGDLQSLFIPADDPANAPCVIHFGGLDVTKEMIYLMHADALAEGRLSMLICDHPGVGEAIRLQGLHLAPESERPAAACLDYLESRGDVPLEKTGIMGISLGGYYAPRAAAFEPRLKFCAAWGAIWDLPACVANCLRLGTGSVPLLEQFRWVFGLPAGADTAGHLAEFRLEPWMHRLTCPILVLHGENDRQAPAWVAVRTYDAAVNSARRDLILVPVDEPGAEHCQIDAMSIGVATLHDWVHDVCSSLPDPL